ncbi:hypothetical protein [Aggregatilinea lenta]|uniref:hypothetical protein n=1 Tax=Aggregatilinea lenta TaxID=913108 RepID=UPI0013C3280B|nr:hypothetical protein [Aggregatilinea lenta]
MLMTITDRSPIALKEWEMGTQAPPSTIANPPAGNANRLGFYISILTAMIAVITLGIAVFTPPISGSYCRKDCIDYPYLDIVSRFPRDYIWMYSAIVLTLLFVALMVCIHEYAPAEKRIFSHIGLAFAIISAVLLVGDYFVQVSVIQPSLENGETDGIALLTQYNPHGLFIALEDIGYLMMSAALLCAVPVFSRTNRVEKAIRWIFIGNFILAIIALVALSIQYGVDRGYRFEVLVLSLDWIVLFVTGILLSTVFRRAMSVATHPATTGS